MLQQEIYNHLFTAKSALLIYADKSKEYDTFPSAISIGHSDYVFSNVNEAMC